MLWESSIRDLVSAHEPFEPLRVVCAAHIMRNDRRRLEHRAGAFQSSKAALLDDLENTRVSVQYMQI